MYIVDMPNRQHAKSSTSEFVDIKLVMYVIYISSLCINVLTFLQFIVKSPELMRLFADDLAYNLVL